MTRLPLLTRGAIETVLPSKAAKIESRLDALQTTFSDKNRMRESAPSGSGEWAASDGCPYRDRQLSQDFGARYRRIE
jgi:hypothetical protein